MEPAGMALGHAEDDAPLADATGDGLAQVRDLERRVASGAPAAIRSPGRSNRPHVDNALGIGAAALRAVVADEQVERAPVGHSRKNFIAQGLKEEIALGRGGCG